MKNILITGSTDGIGKLTALKLAKDGHQIYLHGRSEAKLKAVINEIKAASNNKNITGFVADFSDINAVKKLAEQIKKEVSTLDILINNAGVFKSPTDKTIDGLDLRMAVNYLAPFVLTESLVPILNTGLETRIINLSSAAQATVQKGVLTGDATVNASESYAQSKLALTMWSFNFAKNHPNIVTIAVNPGSLLNTKMAKEAYGQHWSPAEKGVNILYSLAVDAMHISHSGHYFDNDKGSYNKAHPDVYNMAKIKQLLSDTNALI
ncbi:short-chain dehydrogenase [Tamlana sedimentorum]|uniref:Short-chain dehydrogenase n=1 Tax=Neotamlana sedimentorum TaxID=1435349 RepID=A0A0D7WED8_9FLAO|nr:SDR family NAD(P)-dependent oxidoreductase [Tamlana sedimentorum]KJD36107.1 short-chain dehydrogenase [Tamlana sedimentorum]